MSAAQGYDTAGIVITAMAEAKGAKTNFRRQLYAIKIIPELPVRPHSTHRECHQTVFICKYIPSGKKDVKAKLIKIMNP